MMILKRTSFWFVCLKVMEEMERITAAVLMESVSFRGDGMGHITVVEVIIHDDKADAEVIIIIVVTIFEYSARFNIVLECLSHPSFLLYFHHFILIPAPIFLLSFPPSLCIPLYRAVTHQIPQMLAWYYRDFSSDLCRSLVAACECVRRYAMK